MNLLNDIRILLTRWSTAFVLLGVLAVAMAGATLIEAGMNLQAARGIIYNAWWFDLLLLLLCVNFMLIGRRLNLWSRRRRGALLLHYGFIVISPELLSRTCGAKKATCTSAREKPPGG